MIAGEIGTVALAGSATGIAAATEAIALPAAAASGTATGVPGPRATGVPGPRATGWQGRVSTQPVHGRGARRSATCGPADPGRNVTIVRPEATAPIGRPEATAPIVPPVATAPIGPRASRSCPTERRPRSWPLADH